MIFDRKIRQFFGSFDRVFDFAATPRKHCINFSKSRRHQNDDNPGAKRIPFFNDLTRFYRHRSETMLVPMSPRGRLRYREYPESKPYSSFKDPLPPSHGRYKFSHTRARALPSSPWPPSLAPRPFSFSQVCGSLNPFLFYLDSRLIRHHAWLVTNSRSSASSTENF